jgi:hypothetical protein
MVTKKEGPALRLYSIRTPIRGGGTDWPAKNRGWRRIKALKTKTNDRGLPEKRVRFPRFLSCPLHWSFGGLASEALGPTTSEEVPTAFRVFFSLRDVQLAKRPRPKDQIGSSVLIY